MSFKKGLFKNVATFGGFNYLSQILEFMSSVILARLITPGEYGFVALIYVFSGFIQLFTDIGISVAVVRSDYGSTFHRLMFSLSIWLGLILSGLMAILAFPIAWFYSDPKLILPTIAVGLLFTIQSFTYVPSALLSKKLEFAFVGRLKLYSSLFQISAMIILALIGFSYWALIIPIIIAPFLQYLLMERKLHFGLRMYGFRKSLSGLKHIKSLIGSLTSFNTVNYWARNADNMIIGKYYGAVDLGYYNRAYRFLMLAIKLITSTVVSVLYPSLKDLAAKGGNFEKEFKDTLGIISILSFPMAFALILFAKPIVLLLWGKDWILVADYLPYFGILILLQTLTSSLTSIYMLKNKEKAYSVIGIISSFLMVGGIVVGAFYSTLHIVRFYSLSYIILVLPLNFYFGLVRQLKFNFWEVMLFWVPKMIISLFIFASIWMANYYLTVVFSIIYALHLLLLHKFVLIKLKNMVFQRFFNK